jgi:hypothetical protein
MNKKIRALALVIFALAFCKEGLSAQITNLLIGSEEAVIENGLRNADHIQVYIQQLRADGPYYPVSQDAIGGLNFTNKSYLDSQVAQIIRRVAQGAVDNDAGQDRDGPFSVSVVAAKRYADIRKTLLFLGGYLGDFRLIKNGTTYSLPDLSGFVVGTPNNVPYHFPSLAWARLTFVDESGIRVIDSAVATDPFVDLTRSAIILPKDLAASGAVNISVIYGANKQFFGRFDTDGSLLPENPPTMSLSLSPLAASGITKTAVLPTSVSLSVRGGDIGRTFAVQSSTNFTTWEEIPGSTFTVNYNYPYADRNLLTETGGEMKFYRLVPVNRIPVYDK